jgi:type IV secretory pathway TraG/TraD family ATPase VirD4
MARLVSTGKNHNGHTLLLDFRIQERAAVEPAFQLVVDWSARFALMDHRDAFFILNEFARLPGLWKVGNLINAGRNSNTQTLLGIQSVAYLRDTYGRDTADTVLSGLVQTVVFRVGDQPSVKYLRSQLGREQQQRTSRADCGRGRSVGRQELQNEAYPVSDRAVSRLAGGEAVVITIDGWVRGQLARLSEVRWDLRQVLSSES